MPVLDLTGPSPDRSASSITSASRRIGNTTSVMTANDEEEDEGEEKEEVRIREGGERQRSRRSGRGHATEIPQHLQDSGL